MMLMDSNGTLVWNTNTSGKLVSGFNLTTMGNFFLFGKSNDSIWQSFAHPTDCLVTGQRMTPGQKLISSISATNWNQDLFTFEVKSTGLFAYIESNPRQFYFPKLYSDLNVMFSLGMLFLNSLTVKEKLDS
ncbi:EP1-like glycoprotein 2 [Nicotiana tomentosiformis]|uniref:EP1-like glycoprotein 2 n=1 Tax=Nicotiana tomentosiformis TaxID=4098 RepID=UPI00388C7439